MSTSSNMRLNLIMGMVDKITAPVKKVTKETNRMGERIKSTQNELKRLGATSKDIEHFRELKRRAGETSGALDKAQVRVNELAREMKASGTPTRKLTQDFERAKRGVIALKNEYKGQETQLSQVKGRLREAGVSTTRLSEDTRKIKEQTKAYTSLLDKQQIALGRVADQQKKLSKITERNKQMRMNVTVDAVGVGAAIYGLKKLVNAYGEVSSAQGEISSLGIDDAGVKDITKKAKEFSNQWAGTSQAEFIKASYDIKSGIASLSNEAVGEFTKMAALTAGATKSSVGQMTSLFASGYGIYRKQFDQFGSGVIKGWNTLSNAERDAKFGEYFSAGIASSVQRFKTDGSQMSAAISNLGAAATSANVPFSEQLSILGELQATMSGSEAATKYKAFLINAAKAGDALNLTFLDSNNNLKAMPDILDQLRGKYGDTIDAVEEQELKKAFGTDEAIALIKLLYPEMDRLKADIAATNDSLKGGMATTSEMAKKILEGPNESLNRFVNRLQNMAAALGFLFAPAVMLVANMLGDGAIAIANFTEQFPFLSQVIAFAIVGLVGLKAASVAGRFAFSYLSDGFVIARKMLLWFSLTNIKANALLAVTKVRALGAAAAVLYMSGLQKIAAIGAGAMTVAQWALNAAMAANPIGLVVVAVFALIAAAAWLIKDWGAVGRFFGGLWEGIKNAFFWTWEMIKVALSFSPLGVIMEAWEPLMSFFGALWAKISAVFSTAMAWIKDSILNPINAIKSALGGVWDSIFGGGDASLDVQNNVNHQMDQAGGGVVSSSPPISAASSVVSSQSQAVSYGDIVIHAAPGMDAQAVAKMVMIEMDKRDKQAASRARARLID